MKGVTGAVGKERQMRLLGAPRPFTTRGGSQPSVVWSGRAADCDGMWRGRVCTSAKAPTSLQVTLGTTANPSRFAVGCTVFAASRKSAIVTAAPATARALLAAAAAAAAAAASGASAFASDTSVPPLRDPFVGSPAPASASAPALPLPSPFPPPVAATMRLTASMPASLASALRSLPTKPGVRRPSWRRAGERARGES